ncbi:MAG TPA: rhodanese-like domain-containing protein [Actinomycetota bacterium]|nr:rhodanese-like domain-containing protein [Actinomycetota bacterium]
MTPDDAYEQRDHVQFLDVREFYEFAAGHIEGAIHVPLRRLPDRLDALDPSLPVVVACQIGQRSDIAARFLVERGFDAHNLEGGMTRWAERGLPFVSSEGPGEVIDGWAQNLEW